MKVLQIYPALDFWGIAEPYLDNWLKEQFSPLKLKDFIVENKEDILLKATEMPGFLYEALDELRGYSKNSRSNEEKIYQMQIQLQKEKYIIRLIGVGIIVICGTLLILT